MNFKTKHLIFAFLMIVVSILFWGFLSLFFTWANLSNLVYLIIGWLVWLVLFLLFCLLMENRNLIYLTFIISAAFFLLFFFTSEEMIFGSYLVGTLIFLLFMIIAGELMLKEKEQRLDVSVRKIWGKGLPLIITALSLIIALVYYFNPLMEISQEKIEIPYEFFGLILRPAAGIVSKMVPFYDPEMTIDQTLSTGPMFQGQEKTPQLQEIPSSLFNEIDALLQNPEVKDFLKEQTDNGTDKSVLAEQRKQLSQSLGVELKGDETMEVVLANIVNSKINDFVGPNIKAVSFGIAVALFFLLKFVGKLLSILAVIISGTVFSLLRLCKIVKIQEEAKQGKTIKF